MGRSHKVLKLQHTVGTLKAHYQQCRDAVECRRIHVIWLLAEGKEFEEVRAITAYSDWSVRDIISRYNKEGLMGLRNQHITKSGAPTALDKQEQLLLEEALGKLPIDGGRWNGRKMAAWIKKNIGKEISLASCYNYLHKLKFSLQYPRPRHKLANLVVQEEFKKKAFA